MKQLLFIVYIGWLNFYSVSGQRVVPGRPFYRIQNLKSQSIQKLPLYNLPAVDAQLLIKEDKQVENNKLKSVRFAKKIQVRISPAINGVWEKHGDLNIWRIKIKSKGAFSLSIQLKDYLLPPGARLFVYNTEMTEIRGAFSDLNNNEKRQLMIAPTEGDEVIVEYQEPEDAPFNADFRITEVNHDYKGVFGQESTKAGRFGDSGFCNINISCVNDENLIDLSRSVVKIIVDGTELCSGTLLNVTDGSGMPKLLTAAHCLRKTNSPSNILLFFNYDSPHCYDNIEGSDAQTLYGGTLLAFEDSLDFAFYELDNIPPNTYRPYYAGWDASNERATNTTCIHHPMGDVKKYAKSIQELGVSTLGSAYATNAFWLVREWAEGVTEGGSSGAPLFNEENNVIGGLSGGLATCGNPVNDYFFRFDMAFDTKPGSDEQIKIWLDPESTGVEKLDGADPYAESSFCTLISPLKQSDAYGLIGLSGGDGYLSGSNQQDITTFAVEFSDYASVSVEGIYLSPGIVNKTSLQNLEINVWSDNNNQPGALLFSQEVSIRSLDENKLNYIPFSQTLSVFNDFYVGFTFATTSSDEFAVYLTPERTNTGIDPAWIKKSGQWMKASDFLGNGLEIAFWIDVLASDIALKSTGTDSLDAGVIRLYPNPFNDYFTIEIWTASQDASIRIFDLAGREMQKTSSKMSDNSYRIYMPGANSGIYLLEVNDGKSRALQKIVYYR